MSPQLVKNTAWIIGGKLVIFTLSFAFITGLANLVPRDVVGSYNYLISLFAIASIFTLPGMGSALVRSVSRGHEGTLTRIMRLRLSWGTIGSIIALGIGIYYLIQGVPQLGYAFIISAPFVPLTDTLNELAYGFFQGRKNFKKSILLAVLVQAGFSLPTLAILFFTSNLLVIVLVFFGSQAIAGFLVYTNIHPHNDTVDTESIKLGFHLTIMNVLRTIANNVDKIIVWHILGPTSVAIYTFAITPMSKLEQLIPIEMLALPELSNQHLTLALRRKLFIRMLLLMLGLIPCIIFGIILAPKVFALLFPAFPESVALFQLLIMGIIFTPFLLLKTGFTAWGKKKELYTIETLAPTIRIILIFTLGLTFGIHGIIGAIILSKICEGIIIAVLFGNIKPVEIN